MKVLLAMSIAVSSLCVSIYAQQPNSAEATQIVNGRGGTIYPIVNVPLPRGAPIPIVIQGENQVPFITFSSATLAPLPSYVLGGQSVDLDVSQPLAVVFDGLSNAFYTTDLSGDWRTIVTLPESIALNEGLAAQTVVASPSTAEGARLTAAHEMFTAIGITTINLNLSDDGNQAVNLAQYGFSVPFYGTNYSSFSVTGNGLMTFNAATNDFTPTPDEFIQGMPRIAMFWTDLSPNVGGTVTVQIDQSGPLSSVRVAFDSVPEFAVGTAGVPHTFSASIDEAGDILITNDAFNGAPPTFTCMQGITPGGIATTEAQNPVVDFTTLNTNPFISQPNAPVYEWFGTVASPNWTRAASSAFDLTNREIYFGVVSPGVYYSTLTN